MAGIGPAPNPNRRRRNAPARGEWVDLAPLEAPALPELPAAEGEDAWRAVTVATWAAWRQDPVTTQWSPADVAYALDTILLHNTMTASTASEVRLRMDALGLTPKGKRDLRWRISDEGATDARGAAPVPSAHRGLRAV